MSRLVQQALTYIDTPYKHHGRATKRRRGLDCAGLPWRCYADLGVILPDLSHYGREPHQDGLMRAVADALGEPVWQGVMGSAMRDSIHIGDVIVIAFVKEPHHLAIVGDDRDYGLSLIHADGSLGVKRVVKHGLSDHFLGLIVAVFRRPI